MSQTTTTSDTTTSASPAPDIIGLPAQHLACEACGVAVDRTGPGKHPTVVHAVGVEGQPLPSVHPETGQARSTPTASFLRCPACEERADRARLIVEARPDLVRRVGDPKIATHRVLSAMDGVAALTAITAASTSTSSRPGVQEADLPAMLRHLTAPGAGALFVQRYAPMRQRDARPGQGTSQPWSHLTDQQRDALRRGSADVLAERVARNSPPHKIGPPPAEGDGRPVNGGCVLCGIETVVVPAVTVVALGGLTVAQRQKWTPVRASSPSLGGRPDPRRLVGHTCPDCTDAVERVGSVGYAAMERAFLAHLRATGRTDEIRRVAEGGGTVEGLLGWAVLSPSSPTPANSEPWEHVGLVSETERTEA